LIAQHPALRRGVLYIEDFDDVEEKEAIPAVEADPIVVPMFSAEDLELARQQGHDEGVQMGREQAGQERAEVIRLLLLSLSESMAQAQTALLAQSEGIGDELARGLFSALCGSLPALCRAHSEAEMRALIRLVMPGLAHEAKLEIRVHPDLVNAVKHELSELDQRLPETLSVLPDPKLDYTDVRGFWHCGKLVRSSKKIWQDMRNNLKLFDLLPKVAEGELIDAG